MKPPRFYLLLALLLFSIIIGGCGSGGSGADDSADNDPGSATDNEPAQEESMARLVFTEIMYNPAAGAPEFIEMVHTGDEAVDISGYAFSNGIEYVFKTGTVLGPGEVIVLSDVDPAVDSSLAERLPENVRLFAPYGGQLANGGEEIELRDPAGHKVCDITYGDESPWPVAADGFGYSMVVVDATLARWGNAAQDWFASAAVGGFPGTLAATEVMPDRGVRVNEVLSHTDSGGGDAVELYNHSANPVDIGGWYLSDDKNEYLTKFQIPDGTVIGPQGYLVLYATYDPINPANLEAFNFGAVFQLSAHGDELYLFAADQGAFSGYAHGFSFGEVENNIAFGSYVNASGQIQFIAQREKTLGAENAGPYVGHIVISEIMYHADGTVAPCNFVEITNTSNNEVILFDPNNSDNTWAISGIDFSFSEEVTIASGERIVLIPSEPLSVADFKAAYRLGAEIQVYSYHGILQANRQVLEVLKPEDPLEDGTVPYMVVDRAGYDEDHPGLGAADGDGVSLERLDLRAYGDDYTNWRLSEPGGTPGR